MDTWALLMGTAVILLARPLAALFYERDVRRRFEQRHNERTSGGRRK